MTAIKEVDELTKLYTGFSSYPMFLACFNFLQPSASVMRYWQGGQPLGSEAPGISSSVRTSLQLTGFSETESIHASKQRKTKKEQAFSCSFSVILYPLGSCSINNYDVIHLMRERLIPIKDKTGKSITDAFQKIVKTSGRRPKQLWVDQGTEFLQQSVSGVAGGE